MHKSQEQKSLDCAHKAGELCKHCGGDDVSKSTADILKGLTSRMLSMMAQRPAAPTPAVPAAKAEPVAATYGTVRKFEQPVAPVAHIKTPMSSASPTAPDFMASCGSCGYIHKSLSDCPRCASLQTQNVTAQPIWRR